MLQDFLDTLFSIIKEIDCWDMEDPNCVDGATEALAAIQSSFLQYSLMYSIFFILLALLPKYSFKKRMIDDILQRRLIFFLGFAMTIFTMLQFWGTLELLAATRSDSDVAGEILSGIGMQWGIIGMVIYPVTFLIAAILLNMVKNRKLMTIFKSNNKIFGLI